MKILIIDNNTHYKKRLQNLLSKYQTTMINYSQLEGHDIEEYDILVLSGGGITDAQGRKRSLKRFSHLYEQQIKLVQTTKKPVVGICLGCQIIGHSYGADLFRYFKTRRKGLFPIVAIKQNEVMADKDEAMVFQSNRWVITELPEELVCIAASNEGAEIIKHRTKPIWGVQFHPERERPDGDGRKIFHRILSRIKEEHLQY